VLVFQLVSKLGYVGRVWYYFRIGYATYLTFLLGYVSTLITVYYLAIKNIPEILSFFPKFVPFAVLASITGVPFSVAIGWVHLKRSGAYTSELDIGVEANPYNYKLPAGYAKEATVPAMLVTLNLLKRLLEKQGLLDNEEIERIDALERQLTHLIEGGMVGRPRRG
jgi:hypothetical protein